MMKCDAEGTFKSVHHLMKEVAGNWIKMQRVDTEYF
jgi:hypothetical protein